MPTRDKVIETLSQHQSELQQNFGVESLRLFGSVARNESNSESDIDLLYTSLILCCETDVEGS